MKKKLTLLQALSLTSLGLWLIVMLINNITAVSLKPDVHTVADSLVKHPELISRLPYYKKAIETDTIK